MKRVILLGSDGLASCASKLLTWLPVELVHFTKGSTTKSAVSPKLKSAFHLRWPGLWDRQVPSFPYDSISTFIDSSRGIELRLRFAGKCQQVHGDYLIAADGIDSEVRQLLGVKRLQLGTKQSGPYTVSDLAFGRVRLIGAAAHQLFNDHDLALWLEDLAAVEAELYELIQGQKLLACRFQNKLESRQRPYLMSLSQGSLEPQ